jgi:hypothetical protein
LFSVPNPDPQVPSLGLSPDESAPPRPIGPERLRALREAILNGTYPLEAAVLSGLTSLFRHGAPAPAADTAAPPAAPGGAAPGSAH